MTTTIHDPIQLRAKGVKALTDALGPVGMARFLQQFEKGNGDYTRDRARWLKFKSVSEVVSQMRKQKARKSP